MTQVTLPTTSKGSSDPNNFSDCYANDVAITNVLNGGVDTTNIAAGAGIPVSKLNLSGLSGDVSSTSGGVVTATKTNNLAATYRTVLSGGGYIWDTGVGNPVTGTYLLGSTGVGNSSGGTASSGGTQTALADRVPPNLFYFTHADYDVSGLTTKLNVKAQVAVNATAPAVNFVFTLFPVTVAGGADTMVYTAGTAVTGSGATLTTPSASTISQQTSGDFTIPSDGAYLLGVTTTGTMANNSAVSCHAQLRVRNT